MPKEWKIAALANEQIICNFGSEDFDDEHIVWEGDILHVHKAIPFVLKDPDTQEVLENWYPYVGSIKVVEIRPRVTVCENEDLSVWCTLWGSVLASSAQVGYLVGEQRTLIVGEPPRLTLVESTTHAD